MTHYQFDKKNKKNKKNKKTFWSDGQTQQSTLDEVTSLQYNWIVELLGKYT